MRTYNPGDHIYVWADTADIDGNPIAPSSAFDASDIRIYKNGSPTQRSSTSGITPSSPFDSTTGMHLWDIDSSDNADAGFYASGEFAVFLYTSKTIDSAPIRRKLLKEFVIGTVPANVKEIGGDTQSATDLKDFADSGYDPATNKVEGVKLVDTTTTNTDMRGTDSAATAANLATLQTTANNILDDTDEIGTNGAGLSAIPDTSGTTTLLGRLTATRAGYLDNLAAGAIATAAKLLAYFRLALRSDSAIATDHATELGEINANVSSGAGDYANTTEANEALRDRGDAAWITATSVTVSDKTGFKLASDGLALVTSWTVDVTGNITGSLSGSVGSVSGAVGSVTGNVGGNVTGSVGSVLGGIDTTSGTIKTLDALNTAQNAQHSNTQIDTQAIKAKTDNLPSDPADASVIAAAFSSLQSHGDSTWATATGFSTFNAGSDTVTVGAFNTGAKAELQQEAADALTAYDPATGTEAAGLQTSIDNIYDQIGENGDALNQLPWNPAWDAEVQSEVADALTAYSVSTFNVASDRVKLHATQGDYAPAKAGDAMDLVDAPNATAVTAIQQGLSTHSASDAATAVWNAATRTITDKTGFALASNGVDLVIIEGSITASAGLTNDTGTQLTAINLRQALALMLSGDGGVLSGSDTSTSSNTIVIKQAAKPAGVTRISATTDEHGNRDTVTIKVPD